MDFRKIDTAELTKLAEFFAVDVVAVDEASPKKNELVTALKAAEISDDDYVTFQKGVEDAKAKEAAEASRVADDEIPEVVDKYADDDKSNWALIKFEGQNPRLDLLGFTFSKRHPYQLVPQDVAQYAVLKSEGFRLALESELQDFYN